MKLNFAKSLAVWQNLVKEMELDVEACREKEITVTDQGKRRGKEREEKCN